MLFFTTRNKYFSNAEKRLKKWKKNAVYVELNLRKPLSNKFIELENLYFWLGLLLLSGISSQGKDWIWDGGYQLEDSELPVTLLSIVSIHFRCLSPWVFRTRVLCQDASAKTCEPEMNFGSISKLCIEKPRKVLWIGIITRDMTMVISATSTSSPHELQNN